MEFFENLGQGIKSVGSTIKNGAEDITRKTHLNTEIGKVQRDINAFFTQLGEATYKNLTAEEGEKIDPQPIIDNLNGAFSVIREKEEELARIEAEAQARKEEEARRKKEAEEQAAAQATGGVCGMCGAPLLADSKFCVRCGAPVQQAAPEVRCCPNCGARADREARFCVVCGTKIS